MAGLGTKAGDHVPNHLYRHWLADEELGLADARNRPLAGHEHNLLLRTGAFDDRDQLVAGHLWQVKIEENEIEMAGPAQLNSVSRSGRYMDGMPVKGKQIGQNPTYA